jgi:hypothetical protein
MRRAAQDPYTARGGACAMAERAIPSLFESFLSRHPISDEMRRSVATEIRLLAETISNSQKHIIDHSDCKNTITDEAIK